MIVLDWLHVGLLILLFLLLFWHMTSTAGAHAMIGSKNLEIRYLSAMLKGYISKKEEASVERVDQ